MRAFGCGDYVEVLCGCVSGGFGGSGGDAGGKIKVLR